MKKNFSSKVLNIIVIAGIVLTLLALVSLPLVLTAFFKSGLGVTGTNMPMILSIGIFICAVPYVISLFLLKKLCKLITLNKPFSPEIPRYLKRIAIYAFSEIIVFNLVTLVLCYFYDMYLYALTIVPAILVSFIALAVGFLCLVLSRLFAMAIDIKQENDFTI